MGERNAQEKMIGRIIVIILFFGYCGVFAAIYKYVHLEDKFDTTGGIVLSMLWISLLFGALCCDQGWARYVFLVFLVLNLLATIPLFLHLITLGMRPPLLLWVLTFYNFIVFLFLTCSKSVGKLGRK